MATNDTVRARIDGKTKAQAALVLESMGLTVSDAIRLLLVRVASEKKLPFPVKVPNKATRAAMTELKAGKGARFDTLDALFEDLNEDD